MMRGEQFDNMDAFTLRGTYA